MYIQCIYCEIREHREQDADKNADKRATEIVAKATYAEFYLTDLTL